MNALMLRRRAMMAVRKTEVDWRLVWAYNPATDGLLSEQSYITFTHSDSTAETITADGLYLSTASDASKYLKYEFAHGNNTAGKLEIRYKLPVATLSAKNTKGLVTSISNGTVGSIVTRGKRGNNTTVPRAYPWVNSALDTAHSSVVLDNTSWFEEVVEFSADGQKVTIDGVVSTDIEDLSDTTSNYILLQSGQYSNNPTAYISYIRYFEK